MNALLPNTQRAMTIAPNDEIASLYGGEAYVQFQRNGRWGTCGLCPRDIEGRAYPENCPDTMSAAHNRTAEELQAEMSKWYQLLTICGPEEVPETLYRR